ncbi:BLUF domain-containing protein [Aquimarina sp. U1-2]|uniref:BLUF domain-containing protein n=1 Tax=Aquimarina sp. U1-2 TaxID=2823141 RepID=UPI001AECB81F|nr:BLUF domain-containing protein [Aquimarina sp. U1-2]MBP2834154.1 BLUF domain-containing protein [Aquimarina sp. U1-2]
MLHIEKNDEIEQLRQMANHLGADFIENYNSAKLTFDNHHGKGFISTYQIFSGLIAKVYNLRLTKELKFTKKEVDNHPTYFVYCVKGYYFHKFENESVLEKIAKNQNVILSGNHFDGHEIYLPSEVDLQISILFLSADRFEKVGNKKAKRLEGALSDLALSFELDQKSNFFGEINPETSQFAEVLVKNKRIDVIGMLITEGAILNTLASQLLNHEKYRNVSRRVKISKGDLNKMIELGDHIKDNMNTKISVDQLSEISGLNAKKLQKACNYLYGETIGNLIQRLRIERARQLLQTTELTVSEVCYKVGFSSRSYFSKIFTEHFGVLPSDFKNSFYTGEMIFELSYKSKASEETTIDDVEHLVSEAIENNLDHSVTGALVYHSGVFFQIIEGTKSEVLKLYDNILKDKRHHTVELIWKGVKPKRTFGEWSLAFLGEKDTNISGNSANLTFANLAPIMEGIDDSEIFSDILWRRVLNILKVNRS